MRKTWQQIIIFRNAKAEGNPITWEEAAKLAEEQQRKFKRDREIDIEILNQEIDAIHLGKGRPLHGKEN